MPMLKIKDLGFGLARDARTFLRAGMAAVRRPTGTPSIRDLQANVEAQAGQIAQLRERQKRLHERLDLKNEQVAKLQKRLGRGMDLKGPPSGASAPMFFMVGRGRSGTTWLMRLLDAHPEIACKGEGYFFDRNFRCDEFKELHPRLKPSSLYNALAGSEYLRLWIERSVWTAQDRLSPDEHVENLTRLAVEYFMNRRLSRLRRRSPDKRIVGDKTPFISGKVLYEMNVPGPDGPDPETDEPPYNGAGTLEEIARICPDAKVIHVVRDGRDVAVSLMHFMWSRSKDEGWFYELEPEEIRKRRAYREDPTSLSHEGIFTRKRLAAFARSWSSEVAEAVERGPELLGERYYEVRYEDLLTEPEEEVERLLRFLNADASPETVRGCIEATGFEKASSRRQGQEDSSSVSHRKGISGDWKNVFTEEDRRNFRKHAGDLLVRLGAGRTATGRVAVQGVTEETVRPAPRFEDPSVARETKTLAAPAVAHVLHTWHGARPNPGQESLLRKKSSGWSGYCGRYGFSASRHVCPAQSFRAASCFASAASSSGFCPSRLVNW